MTPDQEAIDALAEALRSERRERLAHAVDELQLLCERDPNSRSIRINLAAARKMLHQADCLSRGFDIVRKE